MSVFKELKEKIDEKKEKENYAQQRYQDFEKLKETYLGMVGVKSITDGIRVVCVDGQEPIMFKTWHDYAGGPDVGRMEFEGMLPYAKDKTLRHMLVRVKAEFMGKVDNYDYDFQIFGLDNSGKMKELYSGVFNSEYVKLPQCDKKQKNAALIFNTIKEYVDNSFTLAKQGMDKDDNEME
ncbi:MAG: hypothetical protein IJW59_00200 [Clostridia bacterium]|nr:hypothetical protein [Clostridia bacterium]